MDPVSLLREWTISGKLDSIRLGPDRVEFADSYSFRRDAATAYKAQKGKGDFYSLATLLVFLRNKSTPFPQYVKITKEENVPTVSYLDRKDVEAYLTGKTDSSEYIQLVAPELNLNALPAQQDAQPAADVTEPAAKRARLDPEAALAPASTVAAAAPGSAALSLMQQVARNERRLWDRNSMLTVLNKRFIRAQQLAKEALAEQKRPASYAPSAPRPSSGSRAQQKPLAIPVKPSGRFERSAGPDTTLQDYGFDDIKIQTYGAATAASQANGSAANGTEAAPQPPPQPQPAAPAPKRSAPTPSRPSSSSRPSSGGSRRPDSRYGGVPIIIVPKAYETNLNMFNAQLFLEEGRYQSPQECQALGMRKESKLKFYRSINRSKPVLYQVTDSAPDKRDPAWRRVVAVFVQGKEWQFRDWPFKGAAEGDMVDTFGRMLGVHLINSNEKPPELVKKWNVKIMKLHPNDRHGDMQLARDFYAYLDALLGARKSTLAY